MDYSIILKEYQKKSKIIDYRGAYLYRSLFELYSNVKEIKILYRASEQNKFMIKDLFKFKDFLSKESYILIMKVSNDVFFYIYSRMFNMVFSFYARYYIYDSYLIFKESSMELKNCFEIKDYYSKEGIYTKDIILKGKKLNRNSTFNILDIELLKLIERPK